MRILTRYVVLEFLKVFLLTLAAMTTCMIIVGVFKQGSDEGLGMAQLARLVPFVLPDALRYTVPATVLFAASSVYGRMSGSNEIVAIKSLGISPLSVIWPVLVLTVFLSLIALWLNDVAVTWGYAGVRRVALEGVDDIVYGMLRVQRSYSTSKIAINVKRVEGRKLIQPTLTFQKGDNSRAVTIRADDAELRADPGSGVLVISCHNATVDLEGGGSARLESFEREIPLADAQNKNDQSGSPAYMSLATVYRRLPEQSQAIEQTRVQAAAKAAFQLLSGDFQSLAGDDWRSVANVLRVQLAQWHRLRTEPHRRFASGFSCLCFAMIGIPMAIQRRNSDFLSSFFVCFLPILVVYYPFFVWGLDRAKSGGLPPYCVWLGNLIVVAWGLWLMRRVLRY